MVKKKNVLDREAKKKIDALAKEKRKEMLSVIFGLETKYNEQLKKIWLLKEYFSVKKKDKDVYEEEQAKMIKQDHSIEKGGLKEWQSY
jgi:hypothetical protein